MKTLTANALAEIAEQFATEPLNILEIVWDSGSSTWYADKEVPGRKGKIVTLSQILTLLNLADNQTQQVQVILDDTDGDLKSQIDNVDIHKKTVKLYQWFGDLSDSDKFQIFEGQVSSPILWGEGDRQVTLTIVNEIETYPVGFSPEEGQLDFVSPEYIGRPWPLVFGNVMYAPAQRVRQVESGRLLENFGMVDPLLSYKLEQIEAAYQQEAYMMQFWKLVLEGANLIAPPTAWVLQELIIAIITENQLEFAKRAEQGAKALFQKRAKQNPNNQGFKNGVNNAKANLVVIGNLLDQVGQRLEFLKEMTQLIRYKRELKKRAAREQLIAHNRMRELYAKWLDIFQEICRQQRFVRECVTVQDTKDIFPEGEPVEVCIRGVKWVVEFTHEPEKMCILGGPGAVETDLAVQTWAPDDEPCTDITDTDGLDLFRLEASPPPDLTGKYLLVKKRGTDDTDGCIDRHVVKVDRQVGQKVYITLVPWDRGGPGGQPRGLTLDHIVQKAQDLPQTLGRLGNAIPGAIDVNLTLRPEQKLLLQILPLVGEVTTEQLQMLATLIYTLPDDNIGNGVFFDNPTPRDIYTIIGEDVEVVLEAADVILPHWLEMYCIPYEEIPDKIEWQAEPGAEIRACEDSCEIFVANILPSTIKAVHAYRRNVDGERFLAPVPSSYYTKLENHNLGTIDVTALVFGRSLKEIPGEGWEDDVYVTLSSSVGPNVCDIIQHIVETYFVGKSVNASNFATVKAKLQDGGGDELYPANFALLQKPDALQEIRRIAWESRLAVLLAGNEVFLKYLSEEPSSDGTLDWSDVDTSSLLVDFSRTEELTTELVATFDETYLPLEGRERQPMVVLRHNMAKYGTHRRDEHFHIYNQRELVLKSATFWLIRYANTWQKVKLKTYVKNLAFDTLDTLLLTDFRIHFADSDLKAIVERANYDSQNNMIEFQLNPGIRAGEREQYQFFWPALTDPNLTFPTAIEIRDNLAGGVGPGSGVTGTIPC